MTDFCKCKLCKEIAKKQKYPICSYCNEHHDTRLACPAMVKHNNVYQQDHDKWVSIVEKVGNVLITSKQKNKPKIDPKECDYHIDLEKGKYTVYIKKNPYEFKALRYGESWQDLCGNNLVFYLMVDLIEARELMDKIKGLLAKNTRETTIEAFKLLGGQM